ncbi:hypothetical protein L7F22_009743 [Adiantum nelumboides]|nr:hypothetical protein [Adiantum nelumboides]
MSESTDPLAALIAEPLRVLPPRWRVPEREAELEHVRGFGTADEYWSGRRAGSAGCGPGSGCAPRDESTPKGWCTRWADPGGDLGERLLAGATRTGTCTGGGGRGLADLPDPGGGRRAGLRDDDRLLRGGAGHPDDVAVLRDLCPAPGHEGADGPDGGADAAQVRRRPGRGAPGGAVVDHDAGRAAGRGHLHVDDPDVRRPGGQRLRADRDRLDLDLPVAGVEALKAGSVGTAVPGHDWVVVDDDGSRWHRG